jgi:hypothetical protein
LPELSSAQAHARKEDAAVADEALTTSAWSLRGLRDTLLLWIPLFLIAAAVLTVTSNVTPITEVQRRLILVGLFVVALLFVLRLFAKRRSIVEWFFNLTALVVAIALAALLPALLFGRSDQVFLFKLLLVLIFSLLPGWLYLQFVVAKGQSLREEFILNLFRLHIDHYGNLPCPPRDSLFYRDWKRIADRKQKEDSQMDDPNDNIYLRKLEAVYGKVVARQPSEERPKGDSLFPVILTTVFLALGWVSVLQPEIWGNWRIFTDLRLSGQPEVPADALRFGFAGAYWFILQMLIRRYFQNDLKTDAYISAAGRIVIVLLLVTAVHAVWPEQFSSRTENALAFMIGVFPQIGLHAIKNLIIFPLKRLIKTLDNKYPLSDLDGLNIWYEARLIEEGIEDMQNLASANLVDLMLHLRVPVERLLDWVDQAHLYLRVADCNDREICRSNLRRLGIRTATDLENVFLPRRQDEGKTTAIRYLTADEEEQQFAEIGRCSRIRQMSMLCGQF